MPTKAYKNMQDLYGEEYSGFVEFEDCEGVVHKIAANTKLVTQRGEMVCYDLRGGDEVWEIL